MSNLNIAKNETLKGLKLSLAKYWFTSETEIEISDNLEVYQSGDLMENVEIINYNGGYLARHKN